MVGRRSRRVSGLESELPAPTAALPLIAHRRLRDVGAHLRPRPAPSTALAASGPELVVHHDDGELRRLFGAEAYGEGPLAPSGAGRRYVGIDLCQNLQPEQVAFLLDALAHHRLVTIAGQDLERFSIERYERFANHYGAVVPHSSNCVDAKSCAAGPGRVTLKPFNDRSVASLNACFPGQLQVLPHSTPTVLMVANFGRADQAAGTWGPPGTPQEPPVGSGGGWHTDVEYDPLPLHVSMFLVHKVPTARNARGGTWVQDPGYDPANRETRRKEEPAIHSGFGHDPEVVQLRHSLKPLNGETGFIDTAAAFAALPLEEQRVLENLQVWRENTPMYGRWLAPLVRTNPRSGIKCLHSPNSFRLDYPIRIDGMGEEESRRLLDKLELHILQPRFRYNRPHEVGDVTLWDLFATLHAIPPLKHNINDIADARLFYRLSCKGGPCLKLPRNDDPQWLQQHIYAGYTSPDSVIISAV